MCFDPVSRPQKRPCFVRARWLKLGSQRFSEPQVELREEFRAIPVFFFFLQVLLKMVAWSDHTVPHEKWAVRLHS